MQTNDYTVIIINSMKEWEKVSKSWNDLLLQSSQNSIFLTWEWQFTWAECYMNNNRKPFIIMVYKKDELVGIAPWFIHHINYKITTLKQIESLGTPEVGSDYLDIITKKGKEKEVAIRIYEYLHQEASSQWDSIMLRDIPANSLFLLYFMNRIESDGKYAEIRPGSFCPIVMLPKKGEELLSIYSSHRRFKYKRDLRILSKTGNVIHETVEDGNFDKALQDFLDFYEAKNKKSNKTLRPFLESYISRSDARKTLQIDILRADNKSIASFLHLKYHDNLSMYLMAVDKDYHPHISLGNIFVGQCMSKAIESSFAVYDFLKGIEPYKFHWAEGGRSCITLIFYRKKIIPIVLMMGKFLKYSAKVILR
jgi:hypothetical protein